MKHLKSYYLFESTDMSGELHNFESPNIKSIDQIKSEIESKIEEVADSLRDLFDDYNIVYNDKGHYLGVGKTMPYWEFDEMPINPDKDKSDWIQFKCRINIIGVDGKYFYELRKQIYLLCPVISQRVGETIEEYTDNDPVTNSAFKGDIFIVFRDPVWKMVLNMK